MESCHEDRLKKWKYLSFTLIGILAVGSTVGLLPQASAHITTNVQHMLEHIYSFVDGIEAKTNNLPADPASNTVVNTRASQTSLNSLQATVDAIKTKTDNLPVVQTQRGQLFLNDADHGSIDHFGILGDRESWASTGDEATVFSGHITIISFSEDVVLRCMEGDKDGINTAQVQWPLATTTSVDPVINVDFTCQSLYVDSSTTGANVFYSVQYTEVNDAIEKEPPL